MLRGDFRFEAADHRYFIGQQVVPGVRTVLRVGGVEPDKSFLSPEYQARGKAVHEATLRFDLTHEDQGETLPDAWVPFYRAYVRFRAAVLCRWTLLEETKFSRTRRYATRIDRAGDVNHYPALVEIKTGGPDDFHGPQLAGQDLLLGRGTRRRLCVYLSAQGKFKLVEYTDQKDYLTFLGALRTYWETYAPTQSDPCDFHRAAIVRAADHQHGATDRTDEGRREAGGDDGAPVAYRYAAERE